MPPRPLAAADLRGVRALLTDFDGTLTTGDLLRDQTVAALWSLRHAGIRVALVSGRPAGWGECWARTLPVDGVIVENGGLYFAPDRRGRLRRVYAQPQPERAAGRRRLWAAVRAELRNTPGARLSSDSAYTEVDLAIDYNEQAKLPVEVAKEISRRMRARGFQAVRSSVHVNCWAGTFDKLSMARRFLRREWGMDLAREGRALVYSGDSLNDAPMFGAFPLSVGVANVRPLLQEIDCAPAFVTRRPEGLGFEELARAILRGRQR